MSLRPRRMLAATERTIVFFSEHETVYCVDCAMTLAHGAPWRCAEAEGCLYRRLQRARWCA